MKFEVNEDGTLYKLVLHGDLDFVSSEAFESDIMPRFDDIDEHRIVEIDFLDVKFVDSTGVGSIISFVDELKSRNIQVEIINVCPDVYEVFTLMQVDAILNINIEKQSV